MSTNGLDLPTTPDVSEGPENDGFFEDLGNTTPYLKAIFEGFPASGKTLTMVKLAIGLHQRIKSTKPIVFVSTEKAGKFLKKIFDEAGIRVLQRETKSPADLVEAMKRCQSGLADILLVDSVSHIWEAFVEAYKSRVKRTRLEMLDWGTIKPTWKKEITDPFVNGEFHMLMTGRAGYEYEAEEREDNPKKKDIVKSGIKMRAEGELAYEPDILVLMTRHEDVLGDEKSVWREAMILKDRSTLIDGKTFKNPTFEHFAPAIDQLLADPRKSTATAARDTGLLFHTEEDKRLWLRRRDIALEKIEGELTAAWPGQTADAKRLKVEALRAGLGTTSWTQATGMRPEDLEAGLARIEAFIAHVHAGEKVAEALAAVWPGEGAEAKGLRATALEAVFGSKSLIEVQAQPTDEIVAGFDLLKEHIAQWQAARGAAAVGSTAAAAATTTPAADASAAPALKLEPQTADPNGHKASTLVQRKRINELAGKARIAVNEDVCAWFGKDRTDQLNRIQADEALARLQSIIDQPTATLAAAE